jgi:hypothetical protein
MESSAPRSLAGDPSDCFLGLSGLSVDRRRLDRLRFRDPNLRMLLECFYRLDCRPDGSARSRECSKRYAAAIDRLVAFHSGVHTHRGNPIPIRRIQSVDVSELAVVCSGLVPKRWHVLENRSNRRVGQRVCGSDPCIGHLDLVAKRTRKLVTLIRCFCSTRR